jgi:N-acetylmuramic acid 6-phosphate etherase
MVRLGAVYSNWMINVHMKNRKLITRGVKILCEITHANERVARKTLALAGNDLKIAAVMLSKHCEFDQARLLLKRFRGNLRTVLSTMTKNNRGDQKH